MHWLVSFVSASGAMGYHAFRSSPYFFPPILSMLSEHLQKIMHTASHSATKILKFRQILILNEYASTSATLVHISSRQIIFSWARYKIHQRYVSHLSSHMYLSSNIEERDKGLFVEINIILKTAEYTHTAYLSPALPCLWGPPAVVFEAVITWGPHQPWQSSSAMAPAWQPWGWLQGLATGWDVLGPMRLTGAHCLTDSSAQCLVRSRQRPCRAMLCRPRWICPSWSQVHRVSPRWGCFDLPWATG